MSKKAGVTASSIYLLVGVQLIKRPHSLLESQLILLWATTGN